MQKEDRKPAAYAVLAALFALAIWFAQMKYPSVAPDLLDGLLKVTVLALVCCLIWLIYEHLGDETRNWWHSQKITRVISVFAMLVGGAWIVLPYRQETKSSSPPPAPDIASKKGNISLIPESDLDYTISLSCELSMRPKNRSHDEIHLIQIVQPPEFPKFGFAGSGYVHNGRLAGGDGKIQWSDMDPNFMPRCWFRNHGREAVYDVTGTLFVEWFKTVGLKQQPVGSDTINTAYFEIGANGESPDLYFESLGSDSVRVTLPMSVMLKKAHSTAQVSVKLVPKSNPLDRVLFIPPSPTPRGPLNQSPSSLAPPAAPTSPPKR